MEMITVTAKTVEDAITQASLQLGVSSDRIQYEVVEKGSAGVLGGLFGSKPAVIRAKKIETVDDKAVDFLNSVFDAMGLAVDVEVKMNEEEKEMDVNLTGEFLVGQAVAKAMIKTGTKGVIVNTSSNTQFRVTPLSGAYGPSKGGVGQLTRIMSLELFPHGIRVNAVAPGSAMTRITEATRNNHEKYQRMLTKYSAGRFATKEEITSVMLLLASDDASYVHGETYVVDSGYITN